MNVNHGGYVETNPVIKADNLVREFTNEVGTTLALNGASFEVKIGEFVAVVGASGSGKSTLLNLLAGLDRPTRGCVEFRGIELDFRNLASLASYRLTNVGVVFQDHNLLEELTAFENVALPLQILGWAGDDTRDEALLALERVGLKGLEKRFPKQLSGGQRQRVGIARAITGQKQLLLADEPTGALDSTNTLSIAHLLRDLSRQAVAVVIATHDPRIAALADRVVEIQDGIVMYSADVKSQ